MPPKPTCKVVKRAGQRGARIHPKGCTVRTNVDVGAGTKVRTNKAGEKKRKVVEGGPEHQVTLARAPNAPSSEWVMGVVYDTGAPLLDSRKKLPQSWVTHQRGSHAKGAPEGFIR